jgi:Uma2 family endonuclease
MPIAYDVHSPSRREQPLIARERELRPSAYLAAVRALLTPGGIDSDEPQMETFLHMDNVTLLFTSLYWLWRDRHDFFAASNQTIYYSPKQLKSEDFRGPDFFVVLGTHREPLRRSWVVWDEEGKYPNVIVEVLSASTAGVDRGLKKQIYQDVFHTPEYFLFDPETQELTGYRLDAGKYQPIAPDAAGRFASKELDISLGVHEGRLRFFLPNGALVPAVKEEGQRADAEAQRADTAEERAEAEARRAETAEQRADTAEERAETEARRAQTAAERAETEARRADAAEQRERLLAERLRALGIDPDDPK